MPFNPGYGPGGLMAQDADLEGNVPQPDSPQSPALLQTLLAALQNLPNGAAQTQQQPAAAPPPSSLVASLTQNAVPPQTPASPAANPMLPGFAPTGGSAALERFEADNPGQSPGLAALKMMQAAQPDSPQAKKIADWAARDTAQAEATDKLANARHQMNPTFDPRQMGGYHSGADVTDPAFVAGAKQQAAQSMADQTNSDKEFLSPGFRSGRGGRFAGKTLVDDRSPLVASLTDRTNMAAPSFRVKGAGQMTEDELAAMPKDMREAILKRDHDVERDSSERDRLKGKGLTMHGDLVHGIAMTDADWEKGKAGQRAIEAKALAARQQRKPALVESIESQTGGNPHNPVLQPGAYEHWEEMRASDRRANADRSTREKIANQEDKTRREVAELGKDPVLKSLEDDAGLAVRTGDPNEIKKARQALKDYAASKQPGSAVSQKSSIEVPSPVTAMDTPKVESTIDQLATQDPKLLASPEARAKLRADLAAQGAGEEVLRNYRTSIDPHGTLLGALGRSTIGLPITFIQALTGSGRFDMDKTHRTQKRMAIIDSILKE